MAKPRKPNNLIYLIFVGQLLSTGQLWLLCFDLNTHDVKRENLFFPSWQEVAAYIKEKRIQRGVGISKAIRENCGFSSFFLPSIISP